MIGAAALKALALVTVLLTIDSAELKERLRTEVITITTRFGGVAARSIARA